MATEQDVPALLAAGEEALAEAAFRTGDFGTARKLLTAAHAQAAEGTDVSAQARSLDALGMLAHYENITKLMSGEPVSEADTDAEERLFRRAMACWQQAGEPPASAQSLFGLGLVYQVLHRDWTTAMPYYWQALGLVGNPDVQAELYLRSEVHRHVGFYFLVEAEQPGEAVRHLQISLDLREELGDQRRLPSGLVALAQAELAAGGRDRAIELFRRAVAESREAGLLAERIKDAEQALAEAEAGGEPEASTAAEPEASTAAEPEATTPPEAETR